MPERLLRNVPIERKLTIITMLSSTVALLLACVAFMTYEFVVFRQEIVADLSAAADMVGENSSSALVFGDPDSARRTLRSLNDNPHVIAAAIYDADGNVFASHARADHAKSFQPPASARDGSRFDDNVELFRGIHLADERVGTVYICADLGEMRARLQRYSLIAILVMSAASIVAFLLSRKLHAAISKPISALAGVVGTVGRDQNYAMRVAKQGDDELGQLIDGFNEMLCQIQARDAALADAQRGLEQRVEERTRELLLEIAERHRAEEALRAQEERTRLIVDKAFDAIVSTDAAGSIIEWNAQAEAIFGWSRAEAISRSFTATILPVKPGIEPIAMAQLVSSADGLAINKRIEIPGVAKDGREIPVELAITPIRHGDSRIFNAFLRDLTERKKAETDLADAHRRLLDISREAGMAEVATSVLHNVGNVLNSVNVSANLIAEHVRQSRVSSLARIVTLLREHEHDLGEFVTANPRGKHLLPHLVNLAAHLKVEQATVIAEVGSLHANIEHIKDIVSMQQGYARISGVKEAVSVVDLVEYSLRLNADALSRHGVEVVREFRATPALNVDKHKILQILVNLIQNAKHACDDSGRVDKRVTLRVTCAEDGVRIEVIDNGIGIAAENLTRIFSHGFTTRKNGHGFGLHSGALAARELGGALSVYSEGVGCGAAFVLTLPSESIIEVAACA